MLDVPQARGEALHRLRALVHRNPSEQEAFALLSSMLEDDGRLEDVLNIAKTQLSFAMSLGDSATGDALRLRVADLLERSGRADEALEVYDALSVRPEFAVAALRAIVRIADTQGVASERLADALEHLLPLEQPSDHAALALRLASLRRAGGDSQGEERALTLGLSADPDQVELREALFHLYLTRQEFQKAASVLRHAVERSPNDVVLRTRLAETCQRADEHQGGPGGPGLHASFSERPGGDQAATLRRARGRGASGGGSRGAGGCAQPSRQSRPRAARRHRAHRSAHRVRALGPSCRRPAFGPGRACPRLLDVGSLARWPPG